MRKFGKKVSVSVKKNSAPTLIPKLNLDFDSWYRNLVSVIHYNLVFNQGNPDLHTIYSNISTLEFRIKQMEIFYSFYIGSFYLQHFFPPNKKNPSYIHLTNLTSLRNVFIEVWFHSRHHCQIIPTDIKKVSRSYWKKP